MRHLLLKLSVLVEIAEVSKPAPSDYTPAITTELKQSAKLLLDSKRIIVSSTAVALRVRVLKRTWKDLQNIGDLDDNEDECEVDAFSHPATISSLSVVFFG